MDEREISVRWKVRASDLHRVRQDLASLMPDIQSRGLARLRSDAPRPPWFTALAWDMHGGPGRAGHYLSCLYAAVRESTQGEG